MITIDNQKELLDPKGYEELYIYIPQGLEKVIEIEDKNVN